MGAGPLYIETLTAQVSKRSGQVCGDVAEVMRTPAATTLIVSDGLGSGIKAHLAATMCVARLRCLLDGRMSLRDAFARVVGTMEKARGGDEPYAVFAIARILNDGDTTILTYEMPGPILLGPRHATVIPPRPLTLGTAIAHEYACQLVTGEGILLVSDGITQAGLGRGIPGGWELDGAARFASHHLGHAASRFQDLPQSILAQAIECNRGEHGDDITVLLAACRHGRTLTIFTGPPRDRLTDRGLVNDFMHREGWKVVSGGTTAAIVAAITGHKLAAAPGEASLVAPPRYTLPGVDLVTEGAVTLNQVYNVFDADPASFDEDSAVTQFQGYLAAADRITFIVGRSANPANTHISFRQRGILDRARIVPLLVERLRAAGKLVVVEEV